MNGVHDCGGMHGFGPVLREDHEPVFHDEWERRAFALTLAMGFGGHWNLDMSRHARERIPPGEYLRSSYYEIWLHALETLLAEQHILVAKAKGEPVTPPPGGAEVEALIARGGSTRARDGETVKPARFATGDTVRVRNFHPQGHTRAPRYVRARNGVIARDHGAFVFPDHHAHGLGRSPRHVYSVRFTAQTLWGGQDRGDDKEAGDAVYVDLWDDYLEPAP